MNFLAHAHLSFLQPHILIGNMINDFVKGKKQFEYPSSIQYGIQLHRAIDHFTDNHALTHEMKAFFKPHYRLYSGVFTDVVYDHFLANDITEFATEDALKDFAHSSYQILEENFSLLPPSFQRVLPYMVKQDWFYFYRSRAGIERSFQGLAQRSVYLEESAVAFDIFNTYYNEMQLLYAGFYPDLKTFAAHQLQQLLNT